MRVCCPPKMAIVRSPNAIVQSRPRSTAHDVALRSKPRLTTNLSRPIRIAKASFGRGCQSRVDWTRPLDPPRVENRMNYRYSSIFAMRGIVASTEEDRDLVIDSAIGLRAVLTSRIDVHAFEGDRSLAVAGLLMQGLFASAPASNEFKCRVSDAIKDIRAARSKECGQDAIVAVTIEGHVDSFAAQHEQDADDFVVCFDGADKGEIRARWEEAIAALINAITCNAETVIRIKKVGDAVTFLREDGKPVYSYSASLGAVRGYISRPLSAETCQAINDLYRLFAADVSLQRVQRLIKSSFETDHDSLRSFLAGWAAFEIFVNKVFGIYEERFFTSLTTKREPGVQGKYLERIRDVMKDKYRLADKFAAIAFQLAPSSADDDMKLVMQAKTIRDALSHGESIDESTLPVEQTRELARKYLQRHVEQGRREEA